MKRFSIPAIVALVLVTAVVHADVKTKEKTQIKFGGGILGSIMNRAAGDAAKDGVINTVAVKGNRMSSIGDSTGQIIDLTEEKIYELDLKKKEYKVTTFAEMRQRIKDAQEKAAKQASADLTLPDAPVGAPKDVEAHIKLMIDLQVLAWQADITAGDDAPERMPRREGVHPIGLRVLTTAFQISSALRTTAGTSSPRMNRWRTRSSAARLIRSR